MLASRVIDAIELRTLRDNIISADILTVVQVKNRTLEHASNQVVLGALIFNPPLLLRVSEGALRVLRLDIGYSAIFCFLTWALNQLQGSTLIFMLRDELFTMALLGINGLLMDRW